MIQILTYCGTPQQEEALAMALVQVLKQRGFRVDCNLQPEPADDAELLQDLKKSSALQVRRAPLPGEET